MMREIFFLLALAAAAVNGFGDRHFNDGGSHDIEDVINESAYVDQGIDYAETQTTVNLLKGGEIPSPHRLEAHNKSTVNINGGNVNDLYAYHTSITDVSDGTVRWIGTYGSSTINISGGEVRFLDTRNTSVATISGGTISDSLGTYNSSRVSVSGGSVDVLNAFGSSTVDITGGDINILGANISSTVNISGGSVNQVWPLEWGTVVFTGYDFELAGDHLSWDSGGETISGYGFLSGKWLDGTAWTIELPWINIYATVRLVTVTVPQCGDENHPYPPGDLNEDCHVNFADFSWLASWWKEDNCGLHEDCQKADIAGTGTVDIEDLAFLADHWMECTAPECD